MITTPASVASVQISLMGILVQTQVNATQTFVIVRAFAGTLELNSRTPVVITMVNVFMEAVQVINLVVAFVATRF